MAGAADFVAPRLLAVTVGNYFKHLLIYADCRFARHPRFRYFALNTEMHWRALHAGRIYVCQHPHDAQLFFVLLFISAIIVLQSQALRRNVATERGTSDKMEATRFSQCAHDQRRRLEAEDCDSIQGRRQEFTEGVSSRLGLL